MKKIKLIGTIIKNLFLILWHEAKKLWRKKAGKIIVSLLVVLILGFGGYKIWRNYHPNPNDPNLSLAAAARIGTVTTHKILVQIENRNCPAAIASGCYQRGDIVLIKPGDFQFSDAEKEGFLILRMQLTDKQAEVLVQSIQKQAKNQPKEKTPGGQPMMDTVAMRKYSVDLKKIGIADNDRKGREEDTVYKWDIVREK